MSLLCAIPFVASLMSSCAGPAPVAVGYVEGEYVLLAPIETAQLMSLDVRRGDRVEEGEVLAGFESDDARLAVAEAEATLDQARAQLADLRFGKRPEEMAVLEATLRSAQAQSSEARRVAERARDLERRGIATQAELDKAQTELELAEAAVGQAEANLKVAALPAREDAIKAAQGQVARATAALEQAHAHFPFQRLQLQGHGRLAQVQSLSRA